MQFCLIDAFSYVIGDSYLEKIGHDGLEIIWPGLREPSCRRGFHPQEIICAALELGIMIIRIEKDPMIAPNLGCQPFTIKNDLYAYLEKYDGVITGVCKIRNVRHAIAWKDSQIWDSAGVVTQFSDFEIENFFLILKSNQS